MSRMTHITKADKETREKLEKLEEAMRSLAYTGSDGVDYLPRMAIIEDKLTKSQQKLVDKMMSQLNCTEKEATAVIKS